MSEPENIAIDVIDLKFLPDWVKEGGDAPDYSSFEGEDESGAGRRDRPQRDRGPRRDDRRRKDPRQAEKRGPGREGRSGAGERRPPQRDARPPTREHEQPLPDVGIRFLPNQPVFESVVTQIKSGSIAYSVFSLARLFLEKPERYSVRVTSSEATKLLRLGEKGAIATNRALLEGMAFRSMQAEFYNVETSESEPIKGNFTNVARDRVSGDLLGPTNHHGYQPALRSLYEQRYSRRMSFGEYQRQIQIVNDPAVVEQWKEQARSVTTYTAKNGDAPATFASASDAEKDFRQHHLPALIAEVPEAVIDGVSSRSLQDRPLARAIENAWSVETRSPSNMMQELAGQLRGGGLTIFRHKRGMLFVSPIRPRPLESASTVTNSLRGILDSAAANPGITRKALADKLIPASEVAEQNERAKMSLAADLRWLIGEGHVIEFNNGTLDLPRVKAAPTSQNSPGVAPKSEEPPAAPISTEPSPELAAKEIEPAPEVATEAVEPAATKPADQSPTTLSAGEGVTPS